MSGRAVAALVALGLVACGPPAAAPRAPSNTPSADAPVAEPDGVVVLDPGTGPRRALRYQIADGTTRRATYHARTTPTGAQPIDIDLTWDYAFARAGDDAIVTLTVGPTALPVPAGTTGSWRMGARGRHEAASPSNGGRVVVQQTQAEHMLPVVPAAGVGVGARWTAPLALAAGLGAGPIPGLTTWTLVSLTGTTAVVRATIEVAETEVPFGDTRLTVRGRGAIDARVDLAAYTATSQLRLTFVSGAADADPTAVADIVVDLRIE